MESELYAVTILSLILCGLMAIWRIVDGDDSGGGTGVPGVS